MTRLEAIYAQNELRLHEVGQQLVDLHTKAFTKVLGTEYDGKIGQIIDSYPGLKGVKFYELNRRGYKHYFDNYSPSWSLDSKEMPLDDNELRALNAYLLDKKVKPQIVIIRRVEKPDGIKTPDLLINGEKVEIKRVSSKRSIEDQISKAKKQGATSIIFDSSGFDASDGDIKNMISKEASRKGIAEYAIVRDGKLIDDKIKIPPQSFVRSRTGVSSLDTLTQPLKYVNPFNSYNQGMLDQALKSKFMGKNYSERIWGNTNRLAKDLKQILATAIASGQSEEKTARLIRGRYGVSNYEAERLICTEPARYANIATTK